VGRKEYAIFFQFIIVNPLIIMGITLGGFFNNPLPIPEVLDIKNGDKKL